jgi:hypothetical protein
MGQLFVLKTVVLGGHVVWSVIGLIGDDLTAKPSVRNQVYMAGQSFFRQYSFLINHKGMASIKVKKIWSFRAKLPHHIPLAHTPVVSTNVICLGRLCPGFSACILIASSVFGLRLIGRI